MNQFRSSGHANIVEILIQNGADVNAVAKDGSSALQLAAGKGNL